MLGKQFSSADWQAVFSIDNHWLVKKMLSADVIQYKPGWVKPLRAWGLGKVITLLKPSQLTYHNCKKVMFSHCCTVTCAYFKTPNNLGCKVVGSQDKYARNVWEIISSYRGSEGVFFGQRFLVKPLWCFFLYFVTAFPVISVVHICYFLPSYFWCTWNGFLRS